MAGTLVARGNIRGPQGATGPRGDTGPAGRTFDPEGTVPTKADLAAMSPTPAKGKTWVVVANKHLYVYEGDEAPTSGQNGYDSAVPGWTDMGDISGPKGDTGAQGAQGPIGNTGPQGATGAKGDTGAQGIQGIQGSKGDTGATGAKGDQGTQGVQGPQGNAGPKGDTGSTGATGAKGDTGAQGVQGVAGAAGSRIYFYGGSTGRTQAQANALAAVGDVVIDLTTGDVYDVSNV